MPSPCSISSCPPRAAEPKNRDQDVVYDEAKVPPYDLPPLLVSSEGRPITTPAEWFNIRRPQIMAWFGNLIYGIVPAPESPLRPTFEVVSTNTAFMNGRATREAVRISFENDKRSAEMMILVFTPNDASRPVPAFLQHSFGNASDDRHDAHPNRPGFLRNGSRMQHGTFRKAGCFIGSGVVEAGCKTVIGGRCKQSGIFGSKPGVEKILMFRCIQNS